jgi:D-tyrosyl-tRNA(Tyr) deacylase
MIVCIQRVKESYVKVRGKITGEIKKGLTVLVGFEQMDIFDTIPKLARKCCELRVFEDEKGKMSLSVRDIEGELLIVSQFTLAADLKKGRRPDFTNAKKPEEAKKMYDIFIEECGKILGSDKVKTGIFGAEMEVGIINDGPVTFIIDM